MLLAYDCHSMKNQQFCFGVICYRDGVCVSIMIWFSSRFIVCYKSIENVAFVTDAFLLRCLGTSFVHRERSRVAKESFHIALESLGNVSLSVLDRLISGQHDGREEVREAFSFLGRLFGPMVDLAEVVVENHTEPNAAVAAAFATHCFVAFFHSLLELGPVIYNELVKHKGLVDGLGQTLGVGGTWVMNSRHGSRLEMMR